MVESVRVTINTKPIEQAIARGPATVYYWLRTHLFTAAIEHRTKWLATKGTRFGRGKDAVKVWGINKAPAGQTDPRWVVYRVHPGPKKADNRAQAERLLPKLAAELFAGSVALEVHESGRPINLGGDWLAIPLFNPSKRNPRNVAKWRAANPGKTLITVRDPKRSDRLWLAEPKRYRGRRQEGRQARTKRKKVVRTKLVWRFLLVHRVKNRPTLNFYESWDAQESARQTDFARVCDRILSDIARGKY